ncbi:MAG: heavy metal translocating P-type ATPase [Candidatus Avispirillum sp.]
MKKIKFTKVQKKRLLSIASGAVLFAAGGICRLLGAQLCSDILFAAAGLAAGLMCIVRAFRGIARGVFFDENTLMTIAAVGAVCLGEYPECAAVMILYQVGELFQSVAVGRSRRAISELSSLCPDSARVLQPDGSYKEIAASDVNIGDTVQIRAGERIPADCRICEGVTDIDTSPVTGESVPRGAGVGDEIYSGCINMSGTVLAEVLKRSEDSAAGRILKLTETAGERKTRSEAFITRFAKVYTPLVALIAAAVALLVPLFIQIFGGPSFSETFPDWSRRALSMLVISCPCALVISVPLGYFCGLGSASKKGILIKGSTYVDTLARVDTAVFDKTGTLTEGTLSVDRTEVFDDGDAASLLRLAAGAEQTSSHPIAKAICTAAGEIPAASDITETSGVGVEATVEGMRVCVRRPMHSVEGTAVEVTADGKSVGYIYLSDTVKPSAAPALSELREQGVGNTVMLTGDNESAAQKVAAEVGIDTVYASLMPEEKFEKIEQLCADGCVMYAGDGINDSPSLARADVGVAMGALGSGAAIEAADVVLMGGDMTALAKAKRLARRTVRTVKANIVISLAVKLAVLVLAAFDIVGMWAAVAADVGVCILCVSNSVSLLRK